MKLFGQGRTRLVVAAIAVLLVAGTGVAVAASSSSAPPSNSVRAGRGIDEFGLTRAFYDGQSLLFRYSRGFYCDTHVTTKSSSHCEGGQKAKVPPNKDFDPLYITVPLGFSVPPMSMECPAGKVCVDHPGTIDLRRIEPALKPLYPKLTDAQLKAALANFAVPGHNHFITTKAGHRAEWWDVRIVGVTSKKEYDKLNAHKSTSFLLREVKAGRTTGVIPTNMFLYFSVR